MGRVESSVNLTRCSLRVQPTEEFTLPLSDGYLVWAALLNRISEENPEVSDFLHSPEGRINVSSALGPFEVLDNSHRKRIFRDAEYTIHIGVIGREHAEAVLRPLAFGDGRLRLGDGHVEVLSADTTSATLDDFLAEASRYERPQIEIEFQTPTCILAGEHRTTEMFPHRVGVFESLMRAWKRISEKSTDRLDLTSERIRADLYERPDFDSLSPHNVVINYRGDQKEPVKRFGFSGRCTYGLQANASPSTMNAAGALALFGEYAGIGSAVGRGCGTIETTLTELAG